MLRQHLKLLEVMNSGRMAGIKEYCWWHKQEGRVSGEEGSTVMGEGLSRGLAMTINGRFMIF